MRRLLRLALDTALAPPALLWAGTLPAAAMAVFVASWGDGAGIPTWHAWSFYEQARAIEGGVLLLVLPWVAQRALPAQSRADHLWLAAFTGARPSWLLLSRGGAACAAAALTVLTATPVALLAQRMSGGPLTRVMFDDTAWLGLAGASVVTALWLERRICSPVAAWITNVAVLGVLAGSAWRVAPSAQAAALIGGLAAAGLLALEMRRADRDAAPAVGDVP